MRFNDLPHLIAFLRKAHGRPPASGFVIATKMPDSPALSKLSDQFQSIHTPVSGGGGNAAHGVAVIRDDGDDLMRPSQGRWATVRKPRTVNPETAPGGMEAGTPRASGLPGRLDHHDAGVSGVHRSRICGGLRPGSGCQANSEGWEPESDDSDPAEGCLVAEGIGLDGSCLRRLFDRIRFILLLAACISAISARAFQLTSKLDCTKLVRYGQILTVGYLFPFPCFLNVGSRSWTLRKS